MAGDHKLSQATEETSEWVTWFVILHTSDARAIGKIDHSTSQNHEFESFVRIGSQSMSILEFLVGNTRNTVK